MNRILCRKVVVTLSAMVMFVLLGYTGVYADENTAPIAATPAATVPAATEAAAVPEVEVSAVVPESVSVNEADTGIMTVDLVVFAGQSNMSGAGGNADEAPAVPHGCGYEYRNGKDPAGMYEVTEPFGTSADGYLSDPDGLRKGTLVSAFMNSYYSSTGVPVLAFSAARGGTDMMNYWSTPQVKAELSNKYGNIKAWCAANHVKIRHQYVVWLQGESDGYMGMDQLAYRRELIALFAPLFSQGLEQVFIITPGNCEGAPGVYDQIISGQKTLCANNAHFTLATDTLKQLPNTYLVDGIHYNQQALNLVGTQAAAAAASYTAFH